jgi:hypothetical protein
VLLIAAHPALQDGMTDTISGCNSIGAVAGQAFFNQLEFEG